MTPSPRLERRPLGRTGIELTALGYGTAPIGNLYRTVDDETALAAVHAALDAGITYFDTAPHYGLGLAEVRLGRALHDHDRAEVVISTKVGRVLVPNSAPSGSDLRAGGFDVPDHHTRVFDFSADGVRRSLAGSLHRMGLDRVDIALVHDPDDHLDQAAGEAVPALRALQVEGVVRAVGVGTNDPATAAHMVTRCDLDVVMLAGRWTLIDRSGAAVLALCAQRGVAVLAAAPYNSGLLARHRPGADATFNYAPAAADLVAQATRLAEHAERHGVTLPELALQFALRARNTASVVVGMRSASEVQENVRRSTRLLPLSAWESLDD